MSAAEMRKALETSWTESMDVLHELLEQLPSRGDEIRDAGRQLTRGLLKLDEIAQDLEADDKAAAGDAS